MKNLFSFLCVLALTGCVTGPTTTGRFASPASDRQTAKLINEMAERCWARAFNLVQVGIDVENRVELDGFVISARPGAGSRGNQLPIVRVTVSKKDQKTQLDVAERDFGLFDRRGEKARDVERWLKNDKTCRS